MGNCLLCGPNLKPVIAESVYWRLILNRNQSLLGKCFWALRRHAVAVPDLMSEEWAELHLQIGLATQALALCFQPDHFNYAFLQNQDRHVHLHILPRYAKARTFAGIVFNDPDYPGHYRVPAPPFHLSEAHFMELAAVLSRALGAQGDQPK